MPSSDSLTVNTCLDRDLPLKLCAVGLPLVAVCEDDPVDALIDRVLPRLIEVRLLELQTDLLDLDNEHVLIAGFDNVVGVTRTNHLFCCHILELVPSKILAQHVRDYFPCVGFFVVIADSALDDAVHAAQALFDAIDGLFLIDVHV